MYISPLTKLALLPAPEAAGEADWPAEGLDIERIGGTSTCWIPFFAWIWALILAAAAAAAAAGSEGLRLAEAEAGLLEARASGLRLLRGSLTAGGDRDRRSNLDVRFGSGSFWSKRERLTARRSVSSISNIKTKTGKKERMHEGGL